MSLGIIIFLLHKFTSLPLFAFENVVLFWGAGSEKKVKGIMLVILSSLILQIKHETLNNKDFTTLQRQ